MRKERCKLRSKIIHEQQDKTDNMRLKKRNAKEIIDKEIYMEYIDLGQYIDDNRQLDEEKLIVMPIYSSMDLPEVGRP